MSSSRKLAVPKVATYRILTQLGEYRGWFEGAGAGRRGACSGLSTPCMSMQNLAVVVRVSPFYDVNPSSVRIMTSVALIRATTSLPTSRPSSSALSRVMRLTRWLSPTCSPTLAAASPLTTSVILPGSLLRVLIFTSFLPFLIHYGHQLSGVL